MDVKKDFSKIIYDKRIAIIEGEEIDVSRIPTRVMLNLAELKNKKKELESGNVESVLKLIEIITQVCKSNPKITSDWLIDNTETLQLLDFIEFVLEPLTARGEVKEDKLGKKIKNLKAPMKGQK